MINLKKDMEVNSMSKKIYIPIAIALLAALFAGLWVSTAALAQGSDPASRLRGARRIMGQVTATSADQFSIKTVKGEERSFQVDGETRFFDKDKQELSFDDLQVGRWVIVARAQKEADQVIARLVVILAEGFDPSQLSLSAGTLTSVDVAGSEFSLKTRQGEEKSFVVDEETRFRGAVAGLGDLQSGMQARVLAQKQAGDSLLAQVVTAGAKASKFVGEITAVDAAQGTFTLHTRRGDQDVTFRVDENTRFRSKDQVVKELVDLQPGMLALVVARRGETPTEGETLTAALVAAGTKEQLPKRGNRLGGQVTSIGESSFTIEARDGQQHTIVVTEETRFRSKDGQVQSLEDLQEGMIVLVGGEDLGNNQLQARLVVVVPRKK
jgi:hypothetical protein